MRKNTWKKKTPPLLPETNENEKKEKIIILDLTRRGNFNVLAGKSLVWRPTHLGCPYLGPLPTVLRKPLTDREVVLNDGGSGGGAVRGLTVCYDIERRF